MAESNSSIYGALIANGLIAITKFAAVFLVEVLPCFQKPLIYRNKKTGN